MIGPAVRTGGHNKMVRRRRLNEPSGKPKGRDDREQRQADRYDQIFYRILVKLPAPALGGLAHERTQAVATRYARLDWPVVFCHADFYLKPVNEIEFKLW